MLEIAASNSLMLSGRPLTWGELLADADCQERTSLASGLHGPVAFIVSGPKAAFSALAILATQQLDGLLLGIERLSPSIRGVLLQRGYFLLDYATGNVTPPQNPAPIKSGRISLLTSGSTGTPKIIAHRWETLFTGSAIKRGDALRWLVPYQVGTYAWYQVATLGLFRAGQTLIPADGSDPVALFETAATSRADSISATPTFWRMAFLSVPEAALRAAPFRFITIGGEAVDQSLLDQLHRTFPLSQITHIYASTEAGASIVVKDGKAGFPASRLKLTAPSIPKIKIHDGHLWIRSPFSSSAADGRMEEWLDSGDLVEQRADRVFFIGRANDDMINVGGNKACPTDIASVLLSHPAVRWCRVRAVKSALIGSLPEADLVIDNKEHQVTDADLTAFCLGKLPEYAIPRFWNRLETIPVQSSLKTPL